MMSDFTSKRGGRSAAWIGLVVGAILIVGLTVAGLGAYRAVQAGVIRCYVVEPPLTQTDERLLAGKIYECAWHVCRAVVKISPEYGLACYFPSLLPPGNSASSTAEPKTAQSPTIALRCEECILFNPSQVYG